jgi:hypothetical protein
VAVDFILGTGQQGACKVALLGVLFWFGSVAFPCQQMPATEAQNSNE